MSAGFFPYLVFLLENLRKLQTFVLIGNTYMIEMWLFLMEFSNCFEYYFKREKLIYIFQIQSKLLSRIF